MDQSIRDLFPMVRSKTYLNSAAMAPMPQPSIDRVAAQLADVAANGAANFNEWAEVKARARAAVAAPSRGWTSVANAWDFQDRDQPLVCDSRAWETGMGGSALFYGLEQSLKMINSVGVERIESHLEDLTDFLCEIVPADRFRITSSRAKGEKSQIVAFRPLNGHNSNAVTERLAENNITVSARGDCVRIAPHLFNNAQDIERLAACLP